MVTNHSITPLKFSRAAPGPTLEHMVRVCVGDPDSGAHTPGLPNMPYQMGCHSYLVGSPFATVDKAVSVVEKDG